LISNPIEKKRLRKEKLINDYNLNNTLDCVEKPHCLQH
jgi:hypothetical protein